MIIQKYKHRTIINLKVWFVCVDVVYYFFFFFKQKTAYEIVSRDWSSDVCSSDLPNKETLNNSAETQSDKCNTYHIHVKISFSMMNTKILNT